MPGKPKYYWDSCAIIAWLMGEKHAAGELEGFEEIVKQVENGKAVLFTSALTKSEVLEGRMTPEQKETFSELFQRKNLVLVEITDRVLTLSKEIREWNPKISTPDAIHLATAILYEADEFHTTDGGGKRKRPGDLLPLDGNVAGHNLKICTPRSDQYNLLRGVGPLQLDSEKKQ
jgi:predicted nucleic acid-binding protein